MTATAISLQEAVNIFYARQYAYDMFFIIRKWISFLGLSLSEGKVTA